jgi:anti-sigma B factor antagonist
MALPGSSGSSEAGSSSPLLDLEVHDFGTSALVVLAGEVDASTVGELYERFAELAREGVCHIALNLSDVSFMDSTGLSVLVSEQKRVESVGGEVVMFSPSRQVRKLFSITGLDSFFVVRPRRVRENERDRWESLGAGDVHAANGSSPLCH